MAKFFVSYARSDLQLVESLVRALDILGHEPFYDSDLVAGRKWWTTLLDRIQASDGFLPVLSADYLGSEACFREARWAIALGIPLLPIDIGGTKPGMCEPEIAEANWVRYDLKDSYSIGRLARGLSQLPQVDLPSPLPERPEIPVTYFAELDREIRISAGISPERQGEIIEMLEGMLGTREHDTAESLLIALWDRADLTAENKLAITTRLDTAVLEKHREALAAAAALDREPDGRDARVRGGRLGRAARRRPVALIVALVVLLAAGATLVALKLSHSPTKPHVAATTPLTHPPTTSTTPKASPVAASNLDCTGDQDFLAVGATKANKGDLIFFSRSDGQTKQVPHLPTDWGAPELEGETVNKHFGASTFISLVMPGDLNGDGRPDLIGERADGTLVFMAGTCTGDFTPSGFTMSFGSARPTALTPVGYFNDDHFPDLLDVDHYGRLYLYAGAGRKSGALEKPMRIDDGWTSAIGVGDVNHDGHPDVLDRSKTGVLRLFESDGIGGWKPESARGLPVDLRLPPTEFPFVLGGFDVTHGQYPDLVAIDRSGLLVVFPATGTPGRGMYQRTCARAGFNWFPGQNLVDVADAVSIPGVPIPAFQEPKNSDHPDCVTTSY